MTDTWIPLLVPQEDYAELAALVLARTATRGGPDWSEVAPSVVRDTRNSPDAVDALARFRSWSVDDLRQLANSSVTTAQRWRRAMDACARHVGEFLSTRQVADATGMSVNEWRDASRKISRHLTANYPGAPGWPLVIQSARQVGESDDQAYWAITPDQAALWAQARAEQS